MALTTYETLTTALLQAPSSPVPLIATATLDSYINIARNQVAADGECIRNPATLGLANGVQSYAFSSITLGSPSAGVGSVLSIRSGVVNGAPLDIRGWEWFSAYYFGLGGTGTPTIAAQQGQGVNGTLYFYLTPNGSFTVNLDVVCLPVALVNDSTVEAIPILFADAIPYYAAWIGMMSLQRQADANLMMERYKELIRRARQLSTPTEIPWRLPGGVGAQAVGGYTVLSQPATQAGRAQ